MKYLKAKHVAILVGIVVVVLVGRFVLSSLSAPEFPGSEEETLVAPMGESEKTLAIATPTLVVEGDSISAENSTNELPADTSSTVDSITAPTLTEWARYPDAVQDSVYVNDFRLIVVDRRYRLTPEQIQCPDGDLSVAAHLQPASATGIREVLDAQYIVSDMLPDLTALVTAAKEQGIDLALRTACRGVERQRTAYEYWFGLDPLADEYSLRPGHTEHHTGLAVDFTTNYCSGGVCIEDFNGAAGWTNDFAQSPAGNFLQSNAHLFGFVMPYPMGDECKTGVNAETWHWRWIGTENAQAFKQAQEQNAQLSFTEWLYAQNGLQYTPFCVSGQ